MNSYKPKNRNNIESIDHNVTRDSPQTKYLHHLHQSAATHHHLLPSPSLSPQPSTLRIHLILQMPTQSMHPHKLFPVTLKRLEITAQLFVSFTIMSSSKPFPTSGSMRLYGFSSKCGRKCPLRLDRRVNVDPQPGTVQVI